MTDDLRARLRDATAEADFVDLRRLDADIAKEIGWTYDKKRLPGAPWQDPSGRYHLIPPPFTLSLDAALTLVPEGFDWSILSLCNAGSKPEAVIFTIGTDCDHIVKEGATPPLALANAALEARAARREGSDG